MSADLDKIAAQLDRIEVALGGILERLDGAARGGTSRAPASSGDIAPDSDLDSKYGDEVIKFDPSAWVKAGGASFKGKRMSECSAEFLDAFAAANQLSADKPQAGKEQYAENNRRNARRARGWAKRVRDKHPATVAGAMMDQGGQGFGGGAPGFDGPPPGTDDIPF